MDPSSSPFAPSGTIGDAARVEDSYGTRKRMAFIEAAILEHGPQSVLDVGCGVGNVTLAVGERFRRISILGIDNDRVSIDFARGRDGPDNVRFGLDGELAPDATFDLIIASEVLEHVERPGEFLRHLRGRLRPGGHLLVTVPNGYGPFEIMALVEGLFRLSGLYSLLRAARRYLNGGRRGAASGADTLALSPHVNFFSRARLERLFAGSGFDVKAFRPRTLLCGFLLDQCVRGRRLIEWNARVADRLPAFLSSDWMFLLAPGAQAKSVGEEPSGFYERLHRYFSRRCCELR